MGTSAPFGGVWDPAMLCINTQKPKYTTGGGAGGYHIEPLCHTVPLQASDLEHLDSWEHK